MTISLRALQPDQLPITLSTLLGKIINNVELAHKAGIHYREKVLKQYIDSMKTDYDFILIDCMPFLDMLTINTLAGSHPCTGPISVR